MDFKGMQKYFSPKNMIPQIIGYGIAAFGVFIAIADWLFFGVPFIIVGGCIILFLRDSRPSDNDIDSTAETKIKDLDERAKAHIDVHEKPIRAFQPEVFAGYDYSEPEGLLVSRGSDKKYRTNKYAAAELIFMQDRLHVLMYRFCLTKEDERTTYMTEKYDDLGGASVSSKKETFRLYGRTDGESFERELQTLEIRNNAGDIIFEIPVDAGADVDRTVETINQLVKSKKAQNQSTD